MKRILFFTIAVISWAQAPISSPFATGTGGGGSGGTLTEVTINGTANQITATGDCIAETTVVTCTLSIPSAFVLPGTINGLTLTTSTGTLTITNGKTVVVNNTLTVQATDGTTVVFPAPASVTTGNCMEWTKSGSTLTLTDAGAPCSAGAGDVVGPASATDNAITRFDSTTGKLIQNSGVTIDDSNNVSTPGTFSSGVGSGNAGAADLTAGTSQAIGPNVFGWGAGATMTTSVRLESPNAVPVANSVMLFGAPTSNKATWAYTNTPTLTGTNFTGIPISSLIDLGTGVATALGANVSGTGAICLASGSACAGGSSVYAKAFGASAQTMTGSDVTIYSFSTPALAAGSCMSLKYLGGLPSSATMKVFVDATEIATPVTGDSSPGWNWEVEYCNNAGVQNAQTITFTNGGYAGSISGGNGWTDYFAQAANRAPTAVDWSTSHTLTMKANAASGTFTGFAGTVRYYE